MIEMLGLGEASKATSIALKGLAMVGNMIAAWAIAEVLQLAIKGLDELANSVDNCKERVDSLMSSYQTALDTANSNASRVEELASDYEKLSKGVNNLGENVSLTSEEYEQYNSLVSEIADMFPTLIQGYNDQGTAILNLKGNVEGLRDAYKEAQVSKMLDDMYHQDKISAKEYFDYVKERLSQQLDIYKAALSAVTSLLDDTMDKIQDDIDSLNDKNDALNQQKDDYDSILSVVDDVYQKEIDKLNEQKDLLQDKNGIEAVIKTLGNKSGVDNAHPHRYRRTLATNLLDKGMPIQDVACILGHSELSTTQVYCYINQSNVKASYQKYSA